MPKNTFIPCGEIPINGPQVHYTENCGKTLYWLGYDSYSHYQERGGHPIYGEKDITYTLNSHGYRCPDFDVTADIKVLTMGCSLVLGKGLKQEELFHEIVCERLRNETGKSVVNWNLGSGGASNDFISRLLFLAYPILKPDLVIVNFTEPSRREYFTNTGECVKYVPGNKVEWFEGALREAHILLDKLLSHDQDIVQLFHNYKSVEALLRDTDWFFSAFAGCILPEVIEHVSQKNFVGQFDIIDTSRDCVHPGAKSHQIVADAYWQRMVDSQVVSRLENQS